MIQKQITILESPDANFSFTTACANQPTTFTPTSSAGIISWEWKIGTATYNQQSPIHVFGSPSSFNAELTVTGTNGCVAIQSKQVTVPILPTLNFTSSNNCAQQITSFTDLTVSGSDPVASRAWQFGTLGTGVGTSPTFSFSSSGSYPTMLTITNQSGCSYNISKNIDINNPPIPTFTATPVIGTAPLNVQVVNNTVNSVSQLWSANDPGNSISNEVTANFVFSELGEYVIDLTVSNAEGCSATTSKIISVVVPSLDLELVSLTLDPSSTGEINLLLSIKNKSNTPITNPKALIDISGQVQIKEIINAVIEPGETHNQVLTTGIVGAKNGLDYVCVELLLDGDFDLSNNKLCLSQEAKIVVLDPYPNPGSESMNLEWISENQGQADIYIFDPTGRKVFDGAIKEFAPGLSRMTIPLQNLNPGIYHILFVYEEVRQSFRYIIRR